MKERFRIIVEGDFACFTRPEFKVDRVSYEVPPPGALLGLIESIYWKPAIRYIIDQIVVFNDIQTYSYSKYEVTDKISNYKMSRFMTGGQADPILYAEEKRILRNSLILRNVRYGILFHFDLTQRQCSEEHNSRQKHTAILTRRLRKGQYFRRPCLGSSEYPVTSIIPVDAFDLSEQEPGIASSGVCDLGWMSYQVRFRDDGIPVNGDWDHPVFCDQADTTFYHPYMVNGIIDVAKYRQEIKYADQSLM